MTLVFVQKKASKKETLTEIRVFLWFAMQKYELFLFLSKN